MAAGSTYTPIATQTSDGSASTITFSSIPSTYTDLIFVVRSAGSGGSVDTTLRFNGDTNSNYSRVYMYGSGSSVVTAEVPNQTQIGSGVNAIHHFMNYSNSTTYKTVLGRYWEASSISLAMCILWRSTAAINSIAISIAGSGQTFTNGSTFTLYGIAAA